MHVTNIERGLLGANGIVGGGIPLATGSALASLTNGDNAVSVAFFGDGASNQGCFHECLNMAALWNLPVIYFIQNNQFAVSTNIYNAIHTSSLAQRGKAYDIRSEEVDGTDVLAVYETMRQAVEHARSGKGPVLIECKLYRFTGHFIGDPARYIPESYMKTAHELDAIEKFKRYLLENQVASQEEMDAVEAAAARRIEGAREFARQAPLPDVNDVLAYNYACDNERSVSR